jgi:hypothetical protein
MLLESNLLIIYHFMKFKKILIFTLYIGIYMVKYFFKILFTLLFLNLLSKVAFGSVTLLTPLNGEVLEDTAVHFTWENSDTETIYIYRHLFYVDGNLTGGAIARNLEETQLTRGVVKNSIYLWRVRYHPLESFTGSFDYETEPFIFSVNKEIPEDMLNLYIKDQEEENDIEEGDQEEDEKEDGKGEEKENQEEDEKEDGKGEEKENQEEDEKEDEKGEEKKEKQETVTEDTKTAHPFLGNIPKSNNIKGGDLNISSKIVSSKNSKENIFFQESEFNWNIVGSKSVLGVSQEKSLKEDIMCKFKYLKRGNIFEKIYCHIPRIKFKEESMYPFANEFTIFLKGEIVTSYDVQIDEYVCDFSLFRPKTWFRCEEKFVESKILSLNPNMFFHIYKGNSRVNVMSFFLENNTFRLLAGHVKDVDDMKLVHTYRMVHSEYDLFQEEKYIYSIWPKDYDSTNMVEPEKNMGSTKEKPFCFPFNKIVGVTQWYGNTAYQTPHTGIDFGAKKEAVLAVADGEVIAKGWDSYYGECLSGGNYVKIKQNNGMHTVYFHLEDTHVNTGDFVKKGQIIAKSGNTGAWNCQPLGYHLHFETRLNASSSSHRNPVKYIDIDWNIVPTLGYKRYPGRLTGENPHPGW